MPTRNRDADVAYARSVGLARVVDDVALLLLSWRPADPRRFVADWFQGAPLDPPPAQPPGEGAQWLREARAAAAEAAGGTQRACEEEEEEGLLVELGSQISGAGQSGMEVWHCRPQSPRWVAKLLPSGSPSRRRAELQQELSIARALGCGPMHPNVAVFIGAGDALWDGGAERLPCAVWAKARGGTLEAELRAADPELAPARSASLALGLARGLAHLHRRGVAHRDLKPDNVLLSAPGGRPVISDFNCAWAAPAAPAGALPAARQAESPVTTPWYMPPEMWDFEPYEPFAADVWSLGCLLWELLTLRRCFDPAEDRSLPQIEAAVKGGCPPPPEGAAGALWDAARRCLVLDPAARPSAAAVAGMI